MKLKTVVLLFAIVLIMAIPGIAMNQSNWSKISDEIAEFILQPTDIIPANIPPIEDEPVHSFLPWVISDDVISPLPPGDVEIHIMLFHNDEIASDIVPPMEYTIEYTPVGPIDEDIVYFKGPIVRSLFFLND